MSANANADALTVDLLWLYAPQEKALQLLEGQEFDYVHIDGGRGSSKSTGINSFLLQEALRYRRNRCAAFRRNSDDAIDLDMDLFLKQVPRQLIANVGTDTVSIMPIAVNDGKPLTNDDLSIIAFKGLMSEGRQSTEKAKGEYGAIAFAELDQIEEGPYNMAGLSLRQPDTGRKCLSASNRVIKQHWIRKYFPLNEAETFPEHDFYICENKDCPAGQYGHLVGVTHACGNLTKRHVYRGGMPGYASIWSETFDNKSLSPAYIESIVKNKPAAWIAKYVRGKSGFEPDGRGVFEQIWRPDICVHDSPIHDTWVIRSYDADLNPAITWSQYAKINGVWNYFLASEISAIDVKYSDFLIEAFAYQNEIFGSKQKYQDCGDPALLAENAQTKRSYLDILKQFGIGTVRMRTDHLGNSRSFRIQMVQQWMGIRGDGTSVFHVQPRCETAQEGFEGGYKKKWVQTIGKTVQEPVKDPDYAPVQDTIQYALTNFADLEGNVRGIEPPRSGIRKRPQYDEMTGRIIG